MRAPIRLCPHSVAQYFHPAAMVMDDKNLFYNRGKEPFEIEMLDRNHILRQIAEVEKQIV
jgi:hypothetical protein